MTLRETYKAIDASSARGLKDALIRVLKMPPYIDPISTAYTSGARVQRELTLAAIAEALGAQ